MNHGSKTGSETLGAAGEKGKMTLFKDDRAEDIGAIVVADDRYRLHLDGDHGQVTGSACASASRCSGSHGSGDTCRTGTCPAAPAAPATK